MAYTFTAPTNHSDTGFLFYYPIYFSFVYQAGYVLGSWQWVYTLMWAGKKIITERGSFYESIVGAGMWAYISHYLFIVLSAEFIVRPLGLSYALATVVNFGLTEVAIFVSYGLLK